MSGLLDMQNSRTSFISDETPAFVYTQSLEFIPSQLEETNDIDFLLQCAPIQPSGSSFNSQPYDNSPHLSFTLLYEAVTPSFTHSPYTSTQSSPQGLENFTPYEAVTPSLTDSPYTSTQSSSQGLERFTPHEALPPSLTDSPYTSTQSSPQGLEYFAPSPYSPPKIATSLSDVCHLSQKHRCNIPGCRNRSGFMSLKSRLVHARKVHKTLFFCSCPNCPWMYTYSSFPTMEALNKHWRTSHPNVNHFRCSECSYTTDNVTNIQFKHLNVHFKEEGDISEAMVKIRQEKEERHGRCKRPRVAIE